jgi:hypothetical protein
LSRYCKFEKSLLQRCALLVSVLVAGLLVLPLYWYLAGAFTEGDVFAFMLGVPAGNALAKRSLEACNAGLR